MGPGKCIIRAFEQAGNLIGDYRKTETVTEFSYQVFEEQMASTVLWIHASSDDKFLRDHKYISQRLQWQLEPQDSARAQLQRFYERLSLEPGPKVVIWDNVDSPSDFIKFADGLPSTESTCILITSRDVVFSQRFATKIGCIQLPELSTSESVDLLNRFIKVDMAHDTLRTVTDSLGGLPLAIIQAGSYMLDQNLSPLEFKSLFDNKRNDISNAREYDYSASVASVFDVSLDHLERTHIPALNILYFMSVLAASRIPKYLLLNGPPDSKFPMSMVDLDGYIASLLSYSFIRLTQDQSCLDVHPLVRDVTRTRLHRKGDLAVWEKTALKAVSYEFPRVDFGEWEKCGELLPHALVVLESDAAKDDENSLACLKLCQKAGIYTMQICEYTIANNLLQEAYVSTVKLLGRDSTQSASAATLLARLFLYMGKTHEAAELEEQARKSRTRILGSEHPDTLSSMSNLASIYLALEDSGKAKELLLVTVETSKRILGDEHPDTLSSMTNLAKVLSSQGEYGEAEQTLRDVLALRERVLGTEHPSTLGTMSSLKEVLSRQGKDEEAERSADT